MIYSKLLNCVRYIFNIFSITAVFIDTWITVVLITRWGTSTLFRSLYTYVCMYVQYIQPLFTDISTYSRIHYSLAIPAKLLHVEKFMRCFSRRANFSIYKIHRRTNLISRSLIRPEFIYPPLSPPLSMYNRKKCYIYISLHHARFLHYCLFMYVTQVHLPHLYTKTCIAPLVEYDLSIMITRFNGRLDRWYLFTIEPLVASWRNVWDLYYIFLTWFLLSNPDTIQSYTYSLGR